MKIARQQLRGHVPDVVYKLKPVGPLAESTPIDAVIALPAQNAELRTALLRDIYDPASPRFHQYLSPRQYIETFDPTEASYQSLLDFAKANQLTVVSTAPRKFLHVTAPAAVINKVFHVTLQQYQHPNENRLFYAPHADPAVRLETPVSQITGLDNLRTPRRAPNLLKPPAKVLGSPPHAGGSGNGGLYTGGDFRAAYAPGLTLTGRGQAVGILELDGYVDSDIKMYEQKNGIPNVPLQNVYLDGYAGGGPNEESAADIELVISMAPGIAKAIIYGVPYNNAGIVDALNEMANPTQGEPLPYQITTSYYFFYDKNVYDALARLALQGQAFFVASGDYGSYNEATGSGAFPPADHPLVTSVGGTELQTSGPGGAWTSETTASFSGGGYSPWGGDPQFAIPWWQAGMDYTASKGSTTVRNAPDVSIVADNITVFFNGSWNGFAGTSAAAPLWAGFMALANEQAAASGRPRIGFANPALWAIGRGGNYPTCFHDITTGNNFNGTNPNLYSAVAGYDLCTGWGTPNGKDLINALVGFSPGWGVLPGGGTTVLSDAATVFQNRLYLFGIGINDHHHYVNSFDGQNWSGWSAVPGGGTTNLADAVTVFQNRLYLFGIGINDHHHYVNSFDGLTWSGWSVVPGDGTAAVSNAAAVLQGHLYLFAIGINDHHHYVNSFDGQSWSGWAALWGGGKTLLADAVTVFNNKIYVFGIGINDHQHYMKTFP
jgi:subtilase family serine protease